MKTRSRNYNFYVRPLCRKDLSQVLAIDAVSGSQINDLAGDYETPDDNDSSYGAFLGKKLIGYLSAGGADILEEDLEEKIEGDARLISDVFILARYRENGYATKMLNWVLENNEGIIENGAYLEILDDDLEEFYNRFGFKMIDGSDYIMYRDPVTD